MSVEQGERRSIRDRLLEVLRPREPDDPVLEELGRPRHSRLVLLAVAGSLVMVLLVAGVLAAIQPWRDEEGVPARPAQAVSPQRPAAPAPAPTVRSAGYTFNQPPGWTDRTAELRSRVPTQPGVRADRILSGPTSKGLVANISITRTRVPAGRRTLDVLRQDFLVGLRSRNRSAEPVGAPHTLQVGGASATSFGFRYTQREVEVAGRAVIIGHGRDVFLVLFQTGEADYALQVDALWELLESWRWT